MEKYPFFDPYSYINNTNNKNITKKEETENAKQNNKNIDFDFKEDIFLEEQNIFNNLKSDVNIKEYFETKYYYYRYLNEYLKYKENIQKFKEN